MIEEPQRRDPAPSRWAYRFQRLWLTPVFRSLLRTGIPAFSVVFFVGWSLTDPATRDRIEAGFAGVRQSVAERPEFMVRLMAIDGASTALADEIREILPVDLPASSFDLDLDAMQEVVAGLDAIATADLRIKPGGVLQVSVTERVPAVVWRVFGVLELLDETGRRVAPIAHRADRADLPLITGEGADKAVPEALALIKASAPMAGRLRGLVRMGERRWDVVLDRDQRILLPPDQPIPALERVLALDTAQDLLARDLAVVDMRNPDRPTLRMAPAAVEELRRIRTIEAGDGGG